MFVVLSKLLDLLLAPLTWALLFVVAALVLQRRGGRSRLLLVVAVALLWVFSTAPVRGGLLRLSERDVASTLQPGVVYDAVIVLGGGLDPLGTEASGAVQFNEAPERVLRGFELMREGRARNLLVSGGSLDPRPEAVVEADVLARLLAAWGVPRERIHVEGRSRNTHENAVFSAEVVRTQGWQRLLLVTSAAHMPRALGAFRAVGLMPDALPVDFRAPPTAGGGPAGWLPRAEYLAASTAVLRELAGRLVYRVQGYAR